MPEAYEPINCEAHDELELFCMRGERKVIQYRDGALLRSLEGRCKTIDVRGGEEFLVVEAASGTFPIRLDKLVQIKPA